MTFDVYTQPEHVSPVAAFALAAPFGTHPVGPGVNLALRLCR
jgi:hypothetical protein